MVFVESGNFQRKVQIGVSNPQLVSVNGAHGRTQGTASALCASSAQRPVCLSPQQPHEARTITGPILWVRKLGPWDFVWSNAELGPIVTRKRQAWCLALTGPHKPL